jgi:hypothetical protein
LHPDSGIVYEPVNGTETVDRLGDYVLTLFPLRNVTFDSKQPVLRLFLCGNASKLAHLRGTRRQIGYDDSLSTAKKRQCHCATEAACAPGDNDYDVRLRWLATLLTGRGHLTSPKI